MSRRISAKSSRTPGYVFFGGKGGVGKTTCAAAFALIEGERGRRVLLISTDPAHSLGDALTRKLRPAPRAIPGVRGVVEAAELDADAALERWLGERRHLFAEILARGTYLDDRDIARLLRLSLPGVDELIGLVEIERLAGRRPYDRVVVDLAPTGHALRLLETPEAERRLAHLLDELHEKHRFLAARLGGEHVPDACDAVIEELDAAGRRLEARLRDAAETTFYWVTLPELMAVEETTDAVAALRAERRPIGGLVINRLLAAGDAGCASCRARRIAETAAVAALRSRGLTKRFIYVPEVEPEPRGVEALRRLGRWIVNKRWPWRPARNGRRRTLRIRPVGARGGGTRRVRSFALEVAESVRLVLVAGKGGVGKTTCAATIAATLTAREPRRRVLLLSVDPAHSVADVFGTPVGDPGTAIKIGKGRLALRELDAKRAFRSRQARYRRAIERLVVSEGGRSGVEAPYDRHLAAELVDLAPPGVDELFAILTLIEALGLESLAAGSSPAGRPDRSRSVSAAAFDTVVLDTAPTGHFLRLLELLARAREWVKVVLSLFLKYRELTRLDDVAADLVTVSREMRALDRLLRDRRRTEAIVVTRPAALPQAETRRLVERLRTMKVPVAAIVVNGLTGPGCRWCARRAGSEWREIAPIARLGRRNRERRMTILTTPVVAPPPRGVATLLAWGQRWMVEFPRPEKVLRGAARPKAVARSA